MPQSLAVQNLEPTNKRGVARAITIVEEGDPKNILNSIYNKVGKAYRIGITGPPGAGKSTITNQLAKIYSNRSKSVAIVAVDPTSPFTGGALLGDRVRMNDIGGFPNIYIRSMASRGSLGGLSKKTIDVADLLDAVGFDVIILETVGVGQSELDIAQAADTTIVALVPESGDSIQAMKAGLMEIADFFVLNKSDRPGADSAVVALKSMLGLKGFFNNDWKPEIVQAVASENKGIDKVYDEIERHKIFLQESGYLIKNREKRSKVRIKQIVETDIRKEIWNEEREEWLKISVEEVALGKTSPYAISEKIIEHYKNQFK